MPRAVISQAIDVANPHSADAPTNRAALSWKIRLRPKRSPNRPARTVAIVWLNRYDVTTQETWLWPLRSQTIVGSAVETMVWSSAASSIPSMITPKTRLMWRRSSIGRGGSAGRASAVPLRSSSAPSLGAL
jgi:hypothetical protein